MAAHAITPTPGGGGATTATGTDDRRDAPASASADAAGGAPTAAAAAAADAPSVVIRSLTFSYPGATCPVLSGMSLSLPPGATCLLVGANGAGELRW
jgi:ABC-type multidrug transport system fused ATPase/permease subunit